MASYNQIRENRDQKEIEPNQNEEFFDPVYDEFGNVMPPPQAVYEYYDENYYYEMVVPQKEEVAETTMPPDADLYNRRQKRDKIVQDLQSYIAR